MRFYYVYKALAHPEMDRYVMPFTIEERLLHIAEARRRLGTSIPWLADGMNDGLKQALGNMNNAEVLTDGKGRVVQRRAWSDPRALRDELAALLGRVDNPTRPEDLELKAAPAIETVATGLVPRIELPRSLRAIQIEPDVEKSEHPFYVKLRAEADRALLEEGRGQLYLGFHLDPLYRVHWNNLAEPLEFALTAPDGMRIDTTLARAPRPEASVDADPREFLVEVDAGEKTSSSLDLRVRYFACDDANTFCVPVTQQYRLVLEHDPRGGTVRRGAQDLISLMQRWDADGDGKISREEVPEQFRARFERIDTNGDGFIDADEMQALAQRMRAADRLERRRGRPVEPPE